METARAAELRWFRRSPNTGWEVRAGTFVLLCRKSLLPVQSGGADRTPMQNSPHTLRSAALRIGAAAWPVYITPGPPRWGAWNYYGRTVWRMKA